MNTMKPNNRLGTFYALGLHCVYVLLLTAGFLFGSCRTVPPPIPHNIMGTGFLKEKELTAFFLTQTQEIEPAIVERLARYYREEAAVEGVNSDVAFAQMCLETGFLRFGGLVTADMNNFCGLGAINENNRGISFPDARTGVRAHIQHLKGYASTEPLRLPTADPRYRFVNPKGKAPDIYSLAGTWASDAAYGYKIAHLLRRMYASLGAVQAPSR